MMIKHTAHGAGSCERAADYLTGDRDAAGRPRAGVEILMGDPYLVAAVADSLAFKQKFTHTVMAWAPGDNPTRSQIMEAAQHCTAAGRAGLAPHRVASAAVLHLELAGGCHLHMLTARCDLLTGKSFNPAPPGWRHLYDPLRDYLNCKYGWARPGDPRRARTYQPGHAALMQAERLRGGLSFEDPRALIDEYLIGRIEAGRIRNREDILAALHAAGLEASRTGRRYITVCDPISGRRWRMRGGIYAREWSISYSRLGDAIARPDQSGASSDRTPDPERAEKARREFESALKRRRAYNRTRYGSPESVNTQGVAATHASSSDPEHRVACRELANLLALPELGDKSPGRGRRRREDGPSSAPPDLRSGSGLDPRNPSVNSA